MHKLVKDYVSQVTPTNVAAARSAKAEHETDASELRQHLTELMQGHQELGLAEDEAARAAVAQFGQAKQVRRELKRASLRGLLRDRSFWQAAAVTTLAQIALNAVGAKWLGWNGEVTAMAFPQLYSDHQINFAFAFIWLVQLIIVGKMTARLCSRAAPLTASLYGIYQAVIFFVTVVASIAGRVNIHLSEWLNGYLFIFCFLIAGPPSIYALFAWGFVRRQSARRALQA